MKKSTNEIRNIHEDWALDERNGYPYCGGSVQEFIKRTFNGKAGEFYYDADSSRYLVFADAESRDLFLSDREEYASLLIGTFDAPANYTAEITMATSATNVILAGTTGNYIDFTFDIKSRTGSSTGESAVVTYTFNNSGNVKKVTQVYTAGTSVHFLVDSYLSAGSNSVSIVVTGRNTLASSMAAVNFTVVALELTSTFDMSHPIETGEYLSIPYTLSGAGVKYLEWYIDGVLQQTVDTITDLRVSRVKNISTVGLSLGKHSIQARAYFVNNGTNYYGATLYFDFVVCPANELWDSNVTFVMLALTLPTPATSGVTVNATQYKEFEYEVMVYDSRSRSLTLIVSDNNAQVQSVTMQPSIIQSLSYTPTTVGNHTLTFSCDSATATISVNVGSGDVGIEEVTDNLLLRLSAKGRSNNEVNPGVWAYTPDGGSPITTTFNNFAWNAQSGWNNGALVIPAGASIDITFAPLGGNPVTNGRTIEIDYETTNIEDDDAGVISLVNNLTNAGLTVTASSARLQSSGGANVNTKYKDGDRVHLAFIINKTTGDNSRLLFIVNNGVLERAASFAATDVFQVVDNLHIGSTGCTIKVHSIRVYDRALAVDEAFCNYAVDSDTLIDIANNNDILNETTGMIDADKVNAKIPIMIITGDMQPIFDATDKSVTVYVDVEYRNLQDATKSFVATHLRMRPQGTSSLGYPRKNLRLYTAPKYGCTMTDANGDVIENGLYAFRDNSQPVDCWTLKADYAESSGSHNTGVARLWNKLMYDCQINGEFALRTEAQKAALQNNYGYDVRTAVDGFPIVVFHRQSVDSELVCLGQYNFNNDKSTEKVFGFKDIPGFDNTNVQCFEFLANESPLCLFDDVSTFDSNWDDAFESRYPDTKTPNLVPLKTLATWINSCKGNQSKWNTEKADHFDLPKLAAYYVYLMRFGGVDQTVKNAMITTEDGVHWFFINYDNDTVLGIDNISTVLNAWNYDRTSQKVGGAYYYAGHNSALWNAFEADEECMALVREVDNALYSAGLTYANMVRMFDEEQCDKWCERLYNDNGSYKYIQPFKEKGSAVLYMLQGSRKSYRKWWLQHRMDLYDAKWASGAFRNRIIRFIAEGAPSGSGFTITSAQDTYFGYGINSVPQEVGVAVNKNSTYEFEINRTLAIGDPIAVYNANNISKIDLSEFAQYMTTLYINQAIGNNGKSSLKSLILGDGITENVVFTEIGGLSVISELEEIDIRNFKAITSMELPTLNSLHVFKAADSGLTSFIPAAGVTLNDVSLPATLQSIGLNGAAVTAITYTPTATLRSVVLRNVTGAWDAKTFVNTWLALLSDAQLAQAELTLTGIDWTGMTAAQAITMGKVGNKSYQGKITLTSLTQEEYEQLIELYGQNAFDEEGSFIIDAPETLLISGPTSLMEGEYGTYVATSFPVSGRTYKYLLYYNGSLLPAQTDFEGGPVYRSYNGITLYEESGDISAGSGLSSDTTVTIRAQIVGSETYSAYVTLTAIKVTYPTAVNIEGTGSISQNGFYNYTMSISGSYTAQVSRVTWTLSKNNACIISSSNNDGATITVTDTPATALTVTLSCTVIFTGMVQRSSSKQITLQLTYPSSLSINGNASLDANGSFEYTKAFNTNNFTASVTNVAWSISQNDAVAITARTENGCTLTIASGNETAMNVTLTCIATLTGNVQITGTKTIAVAVIEAPPTEEWVDLGLPSGLLWCNRNVGATRESDYGDYFSWGNIIGHKSTDGSTFDDSYDFGSSNSGPYASTPGAALTGDIPANATYDAAQAIMGGDWRMPSKTDFQELCDNTDNEWTTINGINGRKFMKKTDHSVYVFFPAAGRGEGTTLQEKSGYGYYWSSSLRSADADNGHNLYLYTLTVVAQDYRRRYCGYSVRAVREAPNLVDLGLPSGKLWADRNVGATAANKAGDYFSFGNIEGHKSSDGSTIDDGYVFSSENYANTLGSLLNTDIPVDARYDAARKHFGGQWRMPTTDEFQELYDNTDRTWISSGGLMCEKFMKKTDNSVYILIPASGASSSSGGITRYGSGASVSAIEVSTNKRKQMYIQSGGVQLNSLGDRFEGQNIRAIQTPLPNLVDLGLPSGTLWADRNLGATAPEEAGLYFSWGNTEGHAEGSGYNFNSTTYNGTAAASISDNLSLSQDAAYANLGGDWRMPTKEETKELYDNTKREWTTINGMNGWKFMKKSDHSVYIFLPAAGNYNGTSLVDRGSLGRYWSASFYDSSNAYLLSFNSSTVYPQSYNNRYYGFSVRAVQ